MDPRPHPISLRISGGHDRPLYLFGLGETRANGHVTHLHAAILVYLANTPTGDTVKLLDDAYVHFCKDALRLYLERYTPCSYVHPKYGRCCNFKNTHNAKGHQNNRGKPIGSGQYEPDLDPYYEASWISQIRTCINELQARNYKSFTEPSESRSAAVIHLEFVGFFYGALGGADLFSSHTACFCCLQGLPEYPLPCGHILCRQCVEAHATKSPQELVLQSCPLHTTTVWPSKFIIPVPPKFSGLRVLSLDG